jgi:hypothetical protein
VEATLIVHDSAPRLLESMPSSSPRRSFTLPAGSPDYSTPTIAPIWTQCSIRLDSRQGDSGAAIGTEPSIVGSTPLSLLGLAHTNWTPAERFLAGSNTHTVVPPEVSDWWHDARVAPAVAGHPVVAPALRISERRSWTTLAHHGAIAFAPGAVDSTIEFGMALAPHRDLQHPATLGRTTATPVLPGLIPADRRAEYRVVAHRAGGVEPRTWITPTRIRPSSLLTPLPSAKYSWSGHLEFWDTTVMEPWPDIRRGEEPVRIPLQTNADRNGRTFLVKNRQGATPKFSAGSRLRCAADDREIGSPKAYPCETARLSLDPGGAGHGAC